MCNFCDVASGMAGKVLRASLDYLWLIGMLCNLSNLFDEVASSIHWLEHLYLS